MPNNKSPSPDGYPAEYYRQFWPLLSSLFFKMISEIHQNKTIPHHMNTAYITLIPKPNKDHTSCSNYRPISLINTDIKIISKALSVRLESVISSVIHIDQTGFIKGRHSSENTRRLFNLINFYKNNTSPKKPPFINATLDAEKTFDRVDWSFLFISLNHFGFQSYFTNWIKTLYNSPTASVITNGIISRPFQLLRGTRQGCPLSPLLFALFIEPLAASIRQSNHITGIQSKSHHHKISLYADDILLYITNPSLLLPSVHNLISNYSRVSGYSINWTKFEILPMGRWDAEAGDPLFSHTVKSIKYLGIHISPNLNELFKLNYTPLLQEIKENLERWNKLPLSLIGRISTVKMNILPKINYHFSIIAGSPLSIVQSPNFTRKIKNQESNYLPYKNINNTEDLGLQISISIFSHTNYCISVIGQITSTHHG